MFPENIQISWRQKIIRAEKLKQLIILGVQAQVKQKSKIVRQAGTKKVRWLQNYSKASFFKLKQ